MGWGSASGIFNDMADALIESGAPDEVITRTLTKTIANLRSEDWDTYDESLEHFSDNPAVVEAFRQNEVYLHTCMEVSPDGPWYEYCEHEKDHDGNHKYRDKTWPNEK